MAQTPQQRKAAQRANAAALRRGENILGGEFGSLASQAAERIRDDIAAGEFESQTAPEDDVTLTYRPTKTTWPGNGWKHRRTVAAGYNRTTQTLRIQFFTNGAQYDYYDVPPEIAREFRMAVSPGKFINAVLNGYDYARVI